jgi:hypothetical protein
MAPLAALTVPLKIQQGVAITPNHMTELSRAKPQSVVLILADKEARRNLL